MPRRGDARFPFFFLPRREFGTLVVGNRAWSGVSSTSRRLKGRLGPSLAKTLGRDLAPAELPAGHSRGPFSSAAARLVAGSRRLLGRRWVLGLVRA